jgi:hypothetical protein
MKQYLCTFITISRLVPINIIKLQNNKHFSTINYKIHVCILHASNIMERVNQNVGNEIELDIMIPKIKSRYCKYHRNKDNRTSTFTVQ